MQHRSIARPGARPGPRNTAFLVRLDLIVPEQGFGKVLLEMLRWLRDELGEGNFARRDASTFEREVLAIHLRRSEDAAAFLSAFPKLKLADGATAQAYPSPLFPRGRSAP